MAMRLQKQERRLSCRAGQLIGSAKAHKDDRHILPPWAWPAYICVSSGLEYSANQAASAPTCPQANPDP